MENELKPFWSKFFNFDWRFGLFLILIICIPRIILVLHGNVIGNMQSVGMTMLIMVIAPFIFLSKYGRKEIGIKKPTNNHWLIIAFIIGAIFSILLYFLGETLYGNSFENWYNYIGKSYNIPQEIDEKGRLVMFGISAVIAMTFSPIGEELFFRGIVHSSFANSVSNKKASLIDSSAFAIVHISHFGLVYHNQQWEFLFIPTLIWVLSMFIISILFYVCRKRSGSILGAILCHLAFNLGMTYCIFYPIIGN
ncbi:CPBP family intramembrane glutamic endopeptidase [Gillisia limnaea]|uniref:Abortive infection protein n=1 Tax=Gillisia limnaea (strain DSM 15749 / LMG 21470 / R-8282) TaxID=865937 RepID=H2BXI5_GILLR|nr:CPBP family intramembrane glutamic endopeptidase [Gillisia limnaea]EHQ02067.1 Abortive infection protein [Gillisia limnaea DSM 15749]